MKENPWLPGEDLGDSVNREGLSGSKFCRHHGRGVRTRHKVGKTGLSIWSRQHGWGNEDLARAATVRLCLIGADPGAAVKGGAI
jgi:hypothetical protein